VQVLAAIEVAANHRIVVHFVSHCSRALGRHDRQARNFCKIMSSSKRLQARTIAVSALVAVAFNAEAQATWKLDTRGTTGPIAQVALADSGAKRRTGFIAFEYSRKCDPIFSFAEIIGARLGSPIGQSTLSGTKIGVVVNGIFHTSHAAMTKYDNGYEAGFGITNELFEVLTGKVELLAFVTPEGERVPMPTTGFRQAIQSAFATCAKRFK
jgi:hypothetical protein